MTEFLVRRLAYVGGRLCGSVTGSVEWVRFATGSSSQGGAWKVSRAATA